MGDDVTRLLRWLDAEGSPPVELACAEHPSPRLGPRQSVLVRLGGCATQLEEDALLLLAAAGVSTTVRVDGCSRADALRRRVDADRGIIAAAGADPELLRVGGRSGLWPREARSIGTFAVTRRQLFLLPGGEAPGNLPEAGSTARERTVFALRQLVGPSVPQSLAELPALSAAFEVEGCTGCAVCVRACPETALRISRGDGTFSLQMRAAACIDCGDCVRLCPERAITRTGSAPWGDVLADQERTLAEGRRRVCQRCNASFMPTGDERMCPPCTFRTANPFGSSMPPRQDA